MPVRPEPLLSERSGGRGPRDVLPPRGPSEPSSCQRRHFSRWPDVMFCLFPGTAGSKPRHQQKKDAKLRGGGVGGGKRKNAPCVSTETLIRLKSEMWVPRESGNTPAKRENGPRTDGCPQEAPRHLEPRARCSAILPGPRTPRRAPSPDGDTGRLRPYWGGGGGAPQTPPADPRLARPPGRPVSCSHDGP